MAGIRGQTYTATKELYTDQVEDEQFRAGHVRRLQGLVAALIEDGRDKRTPPMNTKMMIWQKPTSYDSTDQQNQLRLERQSFRRQLQEEFQCEWTRRETRLRSELQAEFQAKLEEALKSQQKSIERNELLEKEKLTRQLKDHYEGRIDKLKAELKTLGSMRVAEKLEPEFEHDSVVEAEELTDPPRLSQNIDQENTNFFFFPSLRAGNTSLANRLRSNSKLTADPHNTTCSTLSNFRVSGVADRISPRNLPRPNQTTYRDSSQRRSLLGPVPQVKMCLPWQ